MGPERMDVLRTTPPLEDVQDSVLLSLRLELVRSEEDLSGESLPAIIG
jgi:hypothetical protein